MDALGRFLEYLVERRQTLIWIMLAVMALLVVLDFIIPAAYDRFVWETIPAFPAVYGFLACVLIIIVAKALGYALLFRREDYYDD